VHVTHAGGTSTHESLMAGVPMVCIPQGSDNPGWAARVQALGAGEIVAETPEAIRTAVRRLLADEGPRQKAQELRDHFARYDGAERLDRIIGDLLSGRD
jgi:UDP:flavonoid glycosyltransferase YjiC (YdhE family)